MTSKQTLFVAIMCGAALTGGVARAEPTQPPATVETVPDKAGAIERLMDAARLGPLMNVVATEGARHGVGLEDSLFPGRGGAPWARMVARIQSPERLGKMLRAALEREIATPAAREALAFYDSDLGAKVAAREVASRRAMLDADVEAGALEASASQIDAGSPRASLVRELIDGLDLVTANVTGGLNANFAFYRGLGDGGAMRSQLSEREMLAIVWNQEAEVRATTARWLDAYLLHAYTPLSDDELRGYVDWAASPAGRRLNAALFAGFGEVFETTSYEMGLAAAKFMLAKDT